MRRNIAIGDIVHIQDRNAMMGEWRIGRGSKVYPDAQGIMRILNYKEKTPDIDIQKGFTTVSRSVQHVIVIVPAPKK